MYDAKKEGRSRVTWRDSKSSLESEVIEWFFFLFRPWMVVKRVGKSI